MRNNYDLGALLLRLAGGGLMLLHGYPKLMKIINGVWEFGDPIGIGVEASLILTVFAEFVCAIFILVGFKSKWAVIPLIITMLVAAFIVHGADPIKKKELAIIYMLIYAAIFFIGSGKYSVDGMIKERRAD